MTSKQRKPIKGFTTDAFEQQSEIVTASATKARRGTEAEIKYAATRTTTSKRFEASNGHAVAETDAPQ